MIICTIGRSYLLLIPRRPFPDSIWLYYRISWHLLINNIFFVFFDHSYVSIVSSVDFIFNLYIERYWCIFNRFHAFSFCPSILCSILSLQMLWYFSFVMFLCIRSGNLCWLYGKLIMVLYSQMLRYQSGILYLIPILFLALQFHILVAYR